MKINKSYLQQVIKEETQKALEEIGYPGALAQKITQLASKSDNQKKDAPAAAKKKSEQDEIKKKIQQTKKKLEDSKTFAKEDNLPGRKAIHTANIKKYQSELQKLETDLKKSRQIVVKPGEEYSGKTGQVTPISPVSEPIPGAQMSFPDDMAPAVDRKKKPAAKKRRTKAQRQATLSRRVGRSIGSIQTAIKSLFAPNAKTFARGGKADGKYGRPGGETESAIKKFQSLYMNDDNPDGLWGKDTEKAYRDITPAKKKYIAGTGPYPGKKLKQRQTASKLDKKIELAKQRHAKLYSDAVLALQFKPPADSSDKALRWYKRDEQKKVRLANKQKRVVDILIARRDARKSGAETAVAKGTSRQ